MDAYALVETAWGVAAIRARGRKLAGIILPAKSSLAAERLVAQRWPDARFHSRLLIALQRQVQRYLLGRREEFDVAPDLSALSSFQQAILTACRKIPYGQTASYGQLAAAAGRPGAARAVGGVMARNPTPLVIPCHRVVRSDGSLGGFSAVGGLGLKRRLLRLEAENC